MAELHPGPFEVHFVDIACEAELALNPQAPRVLVRKARFTMQVEGIEETSRTDEQVTYRITGRLIEIDAPEATT